MTTRRETIKQRDARVSMLLADYDARVRELRKLEKDVDSLKEQVREIEPGTYGDWVREDGTPREIMDQAAVKEDYHKRRVEVPMTTTRPPIVVRPAVAGPATGSRRRH